jgi:hypothetical protein
VKNFHFIRLAKYALMLGVALFIMGLTPVHADTIYAVSGEFANGSSLVGTVSVSATGAITGGSFTLGTGTGVGSTLTFSSVIPIYVTEFSPGVFAASFATAGNPGSAPFITIVFSAGALCTNAAPCNGDRTQFTLDGQNFVNLLEDSSEPINTPEPPTYLLLVGGLIGLGLVSRKRLVTNS